MEQEETNMYLGALELQAEANLLLLREVERWGQLTPAAREWLAQAIVDVEGFRNNVRRARSNNE